MMFLVSATLLCGGALLPTSVEAADPHNSTCLAFAGSEGGYPYAGFKCALDSSPHNYVIRNVVKERDNKSQYQKLLRLPKHPVRCTLIKGGTTNSGGMVSTHYKIKNC